MKGFKGLEFTKKKAARLTAVLVATILLTPIAANAKATSYFGSFSREEFSVSIAPDWSVTYIEATPGKNPVKSPSAKLLIYYATTKARGRLYFRETYDREEGSIQIDCARHSWIMTETVRFAKDKEVSRGPGTDKNAPIIAGSTIDVAAQVVCDGNAAKFAGISVANRAADAASKLAMLQAVKSSNDGGQWIALGQAGTKPNRTAFLVDTANVIAAAGGRRLVTQQVVLENASAGGHNRSLHRLSVDCSAKTGEMLFVVNYKFGSIPFDPIFTTSALSPSIAQAAAAAVCGTPPRPDQILPGSGQAVAASYFKNR